jgi:hypothetical protein
MTERGGLQVEGKSLSKKRARGKKKTKKKKRKKVGLFYSFLSPALEPHYQSRTAAIIFNGVRFFRNNSKKKFPLCTSSCLSKDLFWSHKRTAFVVAYASFFLLSITFAFVETLILEAEKAHTTQETNSKASVNLAIRNVKRSSSKIVLERIKLQQEGGSAAPETPEKDKDKATRFLVFGFNFLFVLLFLCFLLKSSLFICLHSDTSSFLNLSFSSLLLVILVSSHFMFFLLL